LVKNILVTVFLFTLVFVFPVNSYSEDIEEPIDSFAEENAEDSEASEVGSSDAGKVTEAEETDPFDPLWDKEPREFLDFHGIRFSPDITVKQGHVDNIYAMDYDDDIHEDSFTETSFRFRLNVPTYQAINVVMIPFGVAADALRLRVPSILTETPSFFFNDVPEVLADSHLEFDALFKNTTYNDYTEEEVTERFVTGRFEIFEKRKFGLTARGEYSDTFESRADQIVPRYALYLGDGYPIRQGYINKIGAGGLSYRPTPNVTVYAEHYRDNWEFHEVDDWFRDREIRGTSVKVKARSTKDVFFIIEVDGKDIDYDVINSYSTYNLDSTQITGYMGFEWDTPKRKGVFKLGVVKKAYDDQDGFKAFYNTPTDDQEYKDYISIFEAVGKWDVYRKKGRHAFEFGIERSIEEPSVGPTYLGFVTLASGGGSTISTEQRYMLVDEAHIGYRFYFTKNTSMNFGYRYKSVELSDYYDNSLPESSRTYRTDEFITGTMGVRYEGLGVVWALDYSHKLRLSNVSDPVNSLGLGSDPDLADDNFDYIQNTVMLTFSIRP